MNKVALVVNLWIKLLDHFTHPSAYFFRHLNGHIPQWESVDLYPKCSLNILDILKWSIIVIVLHKNQVLVETPQLATHDFVYILFVFERKQNLMITDMLNFKAPSCSLQRSKSSSNQLALKALLVRKLAAMEKFLTLSFGVRQHPGPSLLDRERRVQDWERRVQDCARSSMENCFPHPWKKPH